MKIGVGLSLTGQRKRGEPPVITIAASGTAPLTQSVTDGDTWADLLPATATQTGNYTSTAGAITSAVAEVQIDGGAWTALAGNEATMLAFDESVATRVIVTDGAANMRTFFAGLRTVVGVVPTIAASDNLSGRILTITVDSVTGIPAPAVAFASITLDGAPVSATGSGPWSYTAPNSASENIVAWTVSATNFEGTATASGMTSVPANLGVAAPAQLTAPTITGTIAPGETATVQVGTYSGAPDPSMTGALTFAGSAISPIRVVATVDGVPVTDASGELVWNTQNYVEQGDLILFDIPAGASDGDALNWSETASNGVSPDATDSVSATVSAPTVTVAASGGAGEIVFDPIAPIGVWTASTGGSGEIILEKA